MINKQLTLLEIIARLIRPEINLRATALRRINSAGFQARLIGRYAVARRLHRQVCASFEAQLRLYESKIGQAEVDLQAMVFREGQKER